MSERLGWRWRCVLAGWVAGVPAQDTPGILGRVAGSGAALLVERRTGLVWCDEASLTSLLCPVLHPAVTKDSRVMVELKLYEKHRMLTRTQVCLEYSTSGL